MYPEDVFLIKYTIARPKDQNVTVDSQEDYLEVVRQSERKASPEVAIILGVSKEVCCTPDLPRYCDHNIASRKFNLSQTATNPVKKTKMKEKMTIMTKRQMEKAGRRRSW